jgi:hypothetical protein
MSQEKTFKIVGNDISDGYHTFDELYEHRITLWITLCRILAEECGSTDVWRSRLHSDGTHFEGWFVLGFAFRAGEQITYHLPLSRWDETLFARDLKCAPEWDGHTAADALARLSRLWTTGERAEGRAS